MSEQVDLDQEIREIARATWVEPGGPVLLSSLGARLSPGAKVLVRGSNIPLRRYIQDHLAEQLRLVPMPGQGGAVAPRPDADGYSDGELEGLYRKAAQARRTPRFQPAIWRAFRVPIPTEARRFIYLSSDRPYSQDVPAVQVPTPGGIEVFPDDLAVAESPGELPLPDKVEAAIEAWRAKHEVDLSKLTQQNSQEITDPVQDRPSETRHVSDKWLARRRNRADDLIAGLHVLTDEELARISVPADVVLRIIKRLNAK